MCRQKQTLRRGEIGSAKIKMVFALFIYNLKKKKNLKIIKGNMLFGNAVRGISCVEIGSTFSRGFKSLKKQVANYSTNFFFGLSPNTLSLSRFRSLTQARNCSSCIDTGYNTYRYRIASIYRENQN